MTEKFVHAFLGKLFDSPMVVFDEAMLRPETQDLDAFVDGIHNITEAQQQVARAYFEDGSIDDACPPLQALLHIMAYGNYQGQGIDAREVREMFGRDYLLGCDWYRERLAIKQRRDEALWRRHYAYVQQKLAEAPETDTDRRADLAARLAEAEQMLGVVTSPAYAASLQGTLGADWLHRV